MTLLSCVRNVGVVIAMGMTVPAFAECKDVEPVRASANTDLIETNLDTAHELAEVCSISPKDLLQAGSSRPATQFVDLREAVAASAIQLPGAVRLPEKSLLQGSFLSRERAVVLFAEQHDTPRLLDLCSQLRTNGFENVHVMRGGIRAWHLAGGELVGELAMLDHAEVVDAATAMLLLQQDGTAVLTSGPLPMTVRATVIDSGTRPAHLMTTLQNIDTVLVLAILAKEDVARHVRSFRAANLPEPMYFVEGLSNLVAYAEQQERVANAAATSLQGGCRWN